MKHRLVLVASLAGAGRTTVIRALDDLGYRCIDNLPILFLKGMEDLILGFRDNLVLGLDIRNVEELVELESLLSKLRKSMELQFVFLNAETDVLVNRFKTTRRKHPLLDESGELRSAILRQKREFSHLERELSDVVIDTTFFSPHDLADHIEALFAPGSGLQRQLHVTLVSFGFKYGILREADLVFDVRFLQNPYFVESLKDKSGKNNEVSQYVVESVEAKEFLKKIMDLLSFLVPQYYAERKHYLRIGIGCTGGQHRSVAIAEELARQLAKLKLNQIMVSISHRDKTLPSD